jgi:hypothetical protein
LARVKRLGFVVRIRSIRIVALFFEVRLISNKELLILGAPRSGTTLLAAMLGAHPDIAILHEETSLAMRLILGKSYKGVKLCVPNHIRLSQRGSILYHQLMKIRGVRRINLYMVESKYSIRDYQKIFPNLRVLMILRAPDQVVSSIRRRIHWPKSYGEYCFKYAVKTMWKLTQEDATGCTKVVQFDSLVTQPEHVMREICSWLGCEFDQAMLEGYAFTPQYQNQNINASRASDGKYMDLLERDPVMKEMYLELCRLAV